MYSENIKNYLDELCTEVGISSEVNFSYNTVLCYLATVANSMRCSTLPEPDFLKTNVSISLIGEGLSRSTSLRAELHYLVGMALEQVGASAIQTRYYELEDIQDPFQDDVWFQLYTSFLHYLCATSRLQALCVLRRMDDVSHGLPGDSNFRKAYNNAKKLFEGNYPTEITNIFESVIFNTVETENVRYQLINRLSKKVISRVQILLRQLGLGQEDVWADSRGLDAEGKLFWIGYLENLVKRGITTFTKDQVGNGFDHWLREDSDMLVCLPTGSGKSIVGELRTALALASGKSVVWILPTRSLVRQIKRGLREAFRNLNVEVNELPATEDPLPLYADEEITHKSISVTTPERLSSLANVNPDALSSLGLLVFDEAQLLVEKNRGVTAENTLRLLKKSSIGCKFVLMTAFSQVQDLLKESMEKLGCSVTMLTSDNRPTRRINGILTANQGDDTKTVSAIIYPPRPQQTPEDFRDYQKIFFIRKPTRKPLGATDLAKEFSKKSTVSGLRSVVFVGRKNSTEGCAEGTAKKVKHKKEVPIGYLSRLKLELGRDSTLNSTIGFGVAAHHGGLTPLEQTVVEELVKAGYVQTVFATSTLAQGVNLPFDISIVAFVGRRNPETEEWENIPDSEIQNMLGRAGRAGYVSDGICLVAVKESGEVASTVLSRNKHKFFNHQEDVNFVGMKGLISKCKSIDIGNKEWMFELDGLDLSESVNLLRLAASFNHEDPDAYSNLVESLYEYPSVKGLDSKEVSVFADSLVVLVKNVAEYAAENDQIIKVMAKTGLPPEYVRIILEQTLSDPFDPSESLVDYSDKYVVHAMNTCKNRRWINKLLEKKTPDKLLEVIVLWRNGATISEVEKVWGAHTKRKHRINAGSYLNHKLSLISQFWGIFAVMAELDFLDLGEEPTDVRSLPVFVREGVNSVTCFDWLRTIGGVDRVLSHFLDGKYTITGNTSWEKQNSIKKILADLERGNFAGIQDETVRLSIKDVIEDYF